MCSVTVRSGHCSRDQIGRKNAPPRSPPEPPRLVGEGATLHTYDDMGRLLTETLPDPDGAGPLAPPLNTYTHPANGQLPCVEDLAGQPVSYVYNAAGRVREMSDPRGTTRSPTTRPTEGGPTSPNRPRSGGCEFASAYGERTAEIGRSQWSRNRNPNTHIDRVSLRLNQSPKPSRYDSRRPSSHSQSSTSLSSLRQPQRPPKNPTHPKPSKPESLSHKFP